MHQHHGYTATVYSRPNCMNCRVTARALTSMGIPTTTVQIDEYPFKLELMEAEGWKALPLVEVATPEGETLRWSGMSDKDLSALKYLIKED